MHKANYMHCSISFYLGDLGTQGLFLYPWGDGEKGRGCPGTNTPGYQVTTVWGVGTINPLLFKGQMYNYSSMNPN